MSVNTPGAFTYKPFWFTLPKEQKDFTFEIKSCSQAHFGMSKTPVTVNNGFYEVVFGADQSDNLVRIREKKDNWKVNFFSCAAELTSFYINTC